MKKVNEYVEKLKTATRTHFREQVDADDYKQLLEDLLVQVGIIEYFSIHFVL